MIKPIKDNILVEYTKDKETTSKSGLILATDDKKRDGDNVNLREAKVLEVGHEVEYVKVGDIVQFNPYDGFNIHERDKVDLNKELIVVCEKAVYTINRL